MNAVISGTAGRALLIDGKSLKSFDVDDPSTLVVRHQSDLPYLFGEGRDLRVIENADLDSIAKELKTEADLTLALDLTLISLDEELEEDIRKDAIQDLDELLADAQIRERLEGIMYARPLPDDADLDGALKFCDESNLPNSFAFLKDLDRRQPLISKVSAAWDVIPAKVFGDHEQKSNFQRVAIQRRLFRSLVVTLETPGAISRFLLNAGLDTVVQELRNARQVLQQWSARFRESSETLTIRPDASEEQLERQATPRRKRGRRVGIDRPAVLRDVNKKKVTISAAIQRRDLGLVRELVDDLVNFQRASGETRHLAKSLCDLAMEAKELGMFPLQLELTERSIGEAPADYWSWAQYGDALLSLRRFDEALEAYRKSEDFGAGVLARTGTGEALKAQGKLREALAAFDSVIREHSDDVVAKNGRAEVLKAQGQFSAALAAYNEIIRDYPDNVVAKNGRAEVLKTKGEPDAALAAYNEVISEHPDDVFAKTGRAEVLKTKGELDAALAAYNEVISRHPEDRVARTGRVSILAATGRYEEALSHLPSTKPLTLDGWIDYHILGMIRLRMGKMAEAIRIFDEGVRNDPSPSGKDYFSRALALSWLRGRDFQKASQALDKVKSPLLQPTANVLRIHAFGAQGDVQRATVAYENLSNAPHLRSSDVTQELRHQFILRRPPRKDEHWIADKEAEVLILAA